MFEPVEVPGLPEGKAPLILAKIEISDEGCWLWTASCKENGYGQFNDGIRNWNAHRLVYILSGRPLAKELELDHLCRVRRCVNPDHLEPVTRQINVRRQFDVITGCPQGHEYTIENTYLWRGFRHCRSCREVRNASRKRVTRGA